MKFHTYSLLLKCAATFCCTLAMLYAAGAQTVRLHGSVSMAKTIQTKKKAIQSASGAKLEAVGNGAGRGLADVSNGQAEIALLSGPFKGVADAMNKEKAGSVEMAQLKEIPLFNTTKLGLFAHPAIGVRSLTESQLRDVLTGKITNWKAVGGTDVPIKVVIGFGADGVRVTVKSLLFPGLDYAEGAIVLKTSKEIPALLADTPGACGMLLVKSAEGNIAEVELEHALGIPTSLVVKGEPSGDIKKVIDAAKDFLN